MKILRVAVVVVMLAAVVYSLQRGRSACSMHVVLLLQTWSVERSIIYPC